ncbi:MAG: hypothetical protein ACR2OE_13215 [Thermomicrobiales bacterium]
MSDPASTHRKKKIRAWQIATVIAVVGLIIAVPLIVFGQFRLDLAYRLGLAPGEGVEQIASAKDGVTLIVIPFKLPGDAARDPYRNRAQFLANATGTGTQLTNLSTGKKLPIQLKSLDFITATEDGTHVLMREGNPPGSSRSVLIDIATDAVTELPAGTTTPDLAGDWNTPVWQKTAAVCGPRSVTGVYIACFPSPAFAHYLAGDWQLDLQVYGDYRQKQEIFRGRGLLPSVGFNADDTVIYLQNEHGIWRATIDRSRFRS